ncbi:unnamed protein product [Chilo suppressalis]|uniref:DUF4806 domain-containing protein n=1 Tax=Chilo suppressalis TaxID=168631 RepID=A0ABN8B610_CHISP|nr:unnamed protein product [Chilo suppressalis]
MQQLSDIIILRLKENNKSIVVELQNIIADEINKALEIFKKDIIVEIDIISEQSNQRKLNILRIDIEIENLKEENVKLSNEIKNIERKITTNTTENNGKKLVIYGLGEYGHETEQDLYGRLIHMFYEILNIDIRDAIEEVYKIGKNFNTKRPLFLKLVCKKLVKHIIDNNIYIRGTQIYISEFLDENSRRERRKLRHEMIAARKQGLHAVIRSNELYIESKKIKIQQNLIPKR